MIHYDLSDSEKVCSACDHALHEMSTQVRQELKIVPAQVKVVEHVQHIYSCRHCENHAVSTPIVKARMPNPVIPKGLVSPSAVAFIMIQKFSDGLRLYRQEKQLERMGIQLNRQTLSNWMISSSKRWLKPFYQQLYRHLTQEEVLHADELVTPKSATWTAISYTLKQWPKLITFMKDGRIEIDNNRAERSIKRSLSEGRTGYSQLR